MGFKMNGSPAKMGTIQGTAGHSSALKMKVEENASALKQIAYGGTKTWEQGQKDSGGTLNDLVKQRKGVKKGTPEYNKIQNQINKALGSKKRYDEGPVATEQKTTATEPGSKKLTDDQKNVQNEKIEVQKGVMKDAKTEQRNKRDAAQLEIGEIRSGRDDKYTGTMLSRALGRLKVKRNTRQLKNRAEKSAKEEAANTTTTE